MSDAALAEDVDTKTETDVPAVRDPRSTERLRRSVYVEVVVAIAVLVATSILVAQPRGKESLAADYRQPISATAPLGGGRQATVGVDPGTHGNVNVTITLDSGAAAKSITATATQQSAQIGPLPVKLTRSGDSFSGSVTLPVAGAWRFDLVVTTSSVDQTTTDTTLTLH
jgi:copper transport protein